MKIGKRIRAARENASMSQKDIAKIIGVSDKTISGYEADRILPPLDKLLQLALQLKLPITYFVGNDSKDYKLSSRLLALEAQLIKISSELKLIRIEARKINKE